MKNLVSNLTPPIAKTLALSAFLSLFVLPMDSAQAYTVFFGEDINSSGNPIPFPNSSLARNNFLSNLVGVGTENFESFSPGTSAPLNLDFGAIEATLSGGEGVIIQSNSRDGRFPTSGSKYWEVSAGGSNNFTINFIAPVAAIGFYGIDIGDFGGQLSLNLVGGGSTTLNVPNTIGSNGSTDGSVLFFGAIASGTSEEFSSVSFLTTTGEGDVFGFDDLTVGTFQQVAVPEPLTILGAMTAAGFGAGFKRKLAKSKKDQKDA